MALYVLRMHFLPVMSLYILADSRLYGHSFNHVRLTVDSTNPIEPSENPIAGSISLSTVSLFIQFSKVAVPLRVNQSSSSYHTMCRWILKDLVLNLHSNTTIPHTHLFTYLLHHALSVGNTSHMHSYVSFSRSVRCHVFTFVSTDVKPPSSPTVSLIANARLFSVVW